MKNEYFSLKKMIAAETILPLHSNTQTIEELEEAIRLHKMQLRDIYFHNKKNHLARFNLGLALSYYRKAYFYSDFNQDDINQAIHFAHQAENFFKRDDNLESWEKIQAVLGCSYAVKMDGPRAEHYEIAIPYLENALQSSEAAQDAGYQATLHTLLMMANACRIGGTPDEKIAKIEEHAKKALEVFPDKEDRKWIEYVEQMKAMTYLSGVRGPVDIITEKDYDSVSEVLEQMFIWEENQPDTQLELIPLFKSQVWIRQ